MLSLPVAALGLAAIGAYAKLTVRAVGGLEVSLSTPTDNVASMSDLRVIATVKNTGDKDLEIFKFGTVLDDQHHARPFIVSKDGKEVPFTGTEVCTPHPRQFALSVNTMPTVRIGSRSHGPCLRERPDCHPRRRGCDCRARW